MTTFQKLKKNWTNDWLSYMIGLMFDQTLDDDFKRTILPYVMKRLQDTTTNIANPYMNFQLFRYILMHVSQAVTRTNYIEIVHTFILTILGPF